MGLGAWGGWSVNDPRYRHGGWALLGFFGLYQTIQVYRKRDKGWPEIRECMIGLGLALAARRLFGIGSAQ